MPKRKKNVNFTSHLKDMQIKLIKTKYYTTTKIFKMLKTKMPNIGKNM
jgi:hypothetical protein